MALGASTRLRRLRQERGGPGSRKRPLTLRALSERTGYSIGHLSDVEQGRKQAGPELVEALARALGRSVRHVRNICDQTYREAGHAAA